MFDDQQACGPESWKAAPSTTKSCAQGHGLPSLALAAAARLEAREVRGFETEYVNGLWHWDCHHGSRKVLTPRGEWRTPILFGVLDDHSRLACHLQWYLAESAANIAHGLSQAMQKRGLPRAAISDNGSAMTAAEISEGFARLGILQRRPLRSRMPLPPESQFADEDSIGVAVPGVPSLPTLSVRG